MSKCQPLIVLSLVSFVACFDVRIYKDAFISGATSAVSGFESCRCTDGAQPRGHGDVWVRLLP